jgi:hypothetical protein
MLYYTWHWKPIVIFFQHSETYTYISLSQIYGSKMRKLSITHDILYVLLSLFREAKSASTMLSIVFSKSFVVWLSYHSIWKDTQWTYFSHTWISVSEFQFFKDNYSNSNNHQIVGQCFNGFHWNRTKNITKNTMVYFLIIFRIPFCFKCPSYVTH